jgi:hypothetical protein
VAASAAYSRRSFEGAAPATTLAAPLAAGATSASITDGTGYPTGSSGTFFVVFRMGLSGEEKVEVTSRSGNTLTLAARGADGTADTDHASGVTVHHVMVARDADEANKAAHETVGQITAAGQVLVADGANSLAAVSLATSGQVLVGNGTTAAAQSLSGDATMTSGGVVSISQNAVTYEKMQNASQTDVLLGRDTASTGDFEEITLDDTLEFTGSQVLQRAALTGDVTAAAGSNTTAIAADAVGAAELADGAVAVTANLVDGIVTQAKLATGMRAPVTCTAATRPGSPAEGDIIYETDTDRVLIYTGAAWVRVAWNTAAARTGITLRRAAVQTVATTSVTNVSFDTEDFDSDGFIAVTSATVTVPANLGGLYSLSLLVSGALGGTEFRRFAQITADGDVYRAGDQLEDMHSVALTRPLDAADVVTCQYFQQSGGDMSVTARFDMYRIGP